MSETIRRQKALVIRTNLKAGNMGTVQTSSSNMPPSGDINMYNAGNSRPSTAMQRAMEETSRLRDSDPSLFTP